MTSRVSRDEGSCVADSNTPGNRVARDPLLYIQRRDENLRISNGASGHVLNTSYNDESCLAARASRSCRRSTREKQPRGEQRADDCGNGIRPRVRCVPSHSPPPLLTVDLHTYAHATCWQDVRGRNTYRLASSSLAGQTEGASSHRDRRRYSTCLTRCSTVSVQR